MADGYRTVGGELLTPDGARLSLAVPLEALAAWVEIPETGSYDWLAAHNRIRDEIMPAQAREVVRAIEAVDSVRAVEVVRQWSRALSERVGKALSSSPAGGDTEPTSQPTSGSGTDSEPT